jgi:hypothetical protein
VQTTGWVGFGIGELTSGSMPGADFVIIEFDTQNKPVISDRYSEAYAKPLQDNCQDWKLLDYQINPLSSIFHLQRKLFTNDSQDRVIAPGDTLILWAYGEEQNINYHNSRRGISQIVFIPPNNPVPSLDGTFKVEIRMPDVQLPAERTTYMCYPAIIDIPDITKDYHIVKIDPFVQAENVKFVHHFIVDICYFPPNQDYNATLCQNMEIRCQGLLYGWAMGGKPLVFPEAAGVRVGANDPDKVYFIMLQIHYSNFDLIEGLVDSSGIVLHLTENLRQYDAGNLMIGNIGSDEVTIPGNTPYFRVEADCPSVCTDMWPHPINVFSSTLHMHNTGMMSWATLHRGGQRIPGYISRVEYFGFEFQESLDVNLVIEPGDRMNLVCVYNTVGKPDTKFGIASDNEMCLGYLAYYPKLNLRTPFSFLCGSVHARYYISPDGQWIPAMTAESRNYSTVCWDSLVFDENNYTLVNPDISDYNVNDNSRTFGIPQTQCSYVNDSTGNVPDNSTDGIPSKPDSVNLLLWVALGLAAGIILLGLIFYSK